MFRNKFKNVLIGLSLALSSGPIVFAGPPATVTQGNPKSEVMRAAYLADKEKLNDIQANRLSIIQEIVNDWANEPLVKANIDYWKDEITRALIKASNADLLKIQNAESYSEVQGVLRGDPQVLQGDQQLLSASAANDLIAPASLGDVESDLVFTPVVPCRIFDTRNAGGAYGGATTAITSYKNYQVYGDAATIGGQGGNPSGCYPLYEQPSAISANFTAVPVGVAGHIRIYPWNGPNGSSTVSSSSFLNFNASGSIANAGIIATTLNAAYDISVYHSSNANSVGDVMGYFYPAKAQAGFADGNPGILNKDGELHSFGYSVQITTTTNNQKVFWTAHQPVGTVSAASNLDIWPCWKASGATLWTAEGTVGGGTFGITMTGTQRNIVSASAVVAPGVGDHDFGLCYITTDNRWGNNNWGHVAAQVVP